MSAPESIIFNRAILLAKLEATFRTNSNPAEGIESVTGIDATADVDDSTEEITAAGHPFDTGDGPVQLIIESGALPSPLTVDTDYFVIRVDANTFSLATTRANALAGTAIDLTDAVGVFTVTRLTSDAYLVIEPNFSPDITVLDRANVKPHLSPLPGQTSRRIATVSFQHEIRSNGVIDGGQAPQLGVLLRGCGMSETRYGETGNETETILDDSALPVNSPTGAFTYTKTTAFAGTLPRAVILVCTTPGGSGVAQFSVFSQAVGSVSAQVLNTAQTMTDSVAFDLVESAQITPTITTSFAAGDTFVIFLAPAGHYYEPVSSGFESLTLHVYYQDLLHRVKGARGTFTAEGEAGGFGTFTFTFTGDFEPAVDDTFPANPVFENIVPVQVELAAGIALGGKDFDPTDPDETNLCVQGFSIDIANEVVPRECINDPNSLAGAIIVGRNPVATFNPETVLEGEAPFWGNLDVGERIVWSQRVGSVQGNVVSFHAPYAQYTGITYVNRNEIRAYDVNMRLATPTDTGNDELRIVFS